MASVTTTKVFSNVFDGSTSYREDYIERELPPRLEDDRSWQPEKPAPSPFLETETKRNYVGHIPPPASTGLGLSATKYSNTPFLGRTTYTTFYQDKGARVEDAVPAPPTVLQAPTLPFAKDVSFLGMSQMKRAHQPFKHLPETEFVQPPNVPKPALPEFFPAPLTDETTHKVFFPCHDNYSTSRPVSFKPQHCAASDASFEATASHSNTIHTGASYGPIDVISVKKNFVPIQETRDFSTTSKEALPPRLEPMIGRGTYQ